MTTLEIILITTHIVGGLFAAIYYLKGEIRRGIVNVGDILTALTLLLFGLISFLMTLCFLLDNWKRVIVWRRDKQIIK